MTSRRPSAGGGRRRSSSARARADVHAGAPRPPSRDRAAPTRAQRQTRRLTSRVACESCAQGDQLTAVSLVCRWFLAPRQVADGLRGLGSARTLMARAERRGPSERLRAHRVPRLRSAGPGLHDRLGHETASATKPSESSKVARRAARPGGTAKTCESRAHECATGQVVTSHRGRHRRGDRRRHHVALRGSARGQANRLWVRPDRQWPARPP